MNHPTPEEWISYFYDELDAPSRLTLDQHLEQCPQCAAQLAVWHATGQQLTADTVAARTSFPSGQGRWTRWVAAAAAASIIVTAGFVLGRVTGASRADVTALRDELSALNAQFDARATIAARAETQRQLQPFATGVNDRLRLMQAQQTADYATLRKELETVAVYTDASFRHTENQIVQLAVADNTAPANSNH